MANQTRLESSNDELLAVWTAVENFCAWMSPLLWKSNQSFRWPTARQDMLSSEESLSSEMSDASWSDSVMLSGVADLVFRIPGAEGRWCVIEYKLGRTSPEADLAQACLYHQMLQEKERAEASSLAIVSFSPELHERIFFAASLIAAQAKLKNLIGKLAGVVPGSVPAVENRLNPKSQPDPALGEMERQMLLTFQEFGAPGQARRPSLYPAPLLSVFRLCPRAAFAPRRSSASRRSCKCA